MTQHSEEQSDRVPDDKDSTSAVIRGPVQNKALKFLGLTSPRKLLDFVAGGLLWSLMHAVSDFSRGKRIDLEVILALATVWLVLFAVFYSKSWLEDEEETIELTPEPFTSKASELPRLLKKAVQVMHLSAEFEEANLGVWRALSYLSKKLDPAHKAVFTEDTIGDLKGFLASETRRDRLETIVRICAIAADPELLPLLRDLKDRTKDLDVLDNLRVVLREAISACAKSA